MFCHQLIVFLLRVLSFSIGKAWRGRRSVMAGEVVPVVLPEHVLQMAMSASLRAARVLFWHSGEGEEYVE